MLVGFHYQSWSWWRRSLADEGGPASQAAIDTGADVPRSLSRAHCRGQRRMHRWKPSILGDKLDWEIFQTVIVFCVLGKPMEEPSQHDNLSLNGRIHITSSGRPEPWEPGSVYPLMHSRNVRATFFVCEFKHCGRALYTFTTMIVACCGRSESSRARPLKQVGLLDRQGFAVIAMSFSMKSSQLIYQVRLVKGQTNLRDSERPRPHTVAFSESQIWPQKEPRTVFR